MPDLRERLRQSIAENYDVERELGRGGMAVVFLAHDHKHDRKVAIKVLRPELAESVGPERFLGEVRIAASLSHPNILPVHDSGEADGLLYYVMPYVEGESLRVRLSQGGKLPVPEATQLLRELADALAYAHRHGVIHRDIKPDNVLLAEGHVEIMDFGLAKILRQATSHEQLTSAGVALGTPSYMAPEQAAGDEHVDHRADIYSLGVMAYEMLGGATPFAGTSAQQILRAHVTRPPAPVSEVRDNLPPPLVDLVMRCLAKEPADRFQTADELLPVLAGLLTPSSGVASVQPSSRRWTWRAAAAVLLMGIAAWAFFAWLSDSDGGSGADQTMPSIAVLPFADAAADDEGAYFGDGLAEDLIYALHNVSGLRVAGKTSSFSFKDTGETLQKIGEKLRVQTVLTGSVRRVGESLRVNVQLENASDGFVLWSGQYDRRMDDVFAIQDEIARAVVGKLKAEPLGDSATLVEPPTANVEAYHLYLRGRFFWAQRGEGIRKGLKFFEQAVALDRNYALAHAGIGDAYVLLGLYGMLRPGEAMQKAKSAAQRALEIDPDLAEAETTLGYVAIFYDWQWDQAKRRLQRALELKPSYVTGHYWYSTYLACVADRAEDAVASTKRAVDLDPVSHLALSLLGYTTACAGRFDEAVVYMRRGVDLQRQWGSLRFLGFALSVASQREEAVSVLEEAVALSRGHPWTVSDLAVTLSEVDVERATTLYRELEKRRRTGYVQPALLGMVAGALGQIDEAVDWMELAHQERDAYLILLYRHPYVRRGKLRDLVNHPRVLTLWRKMGLR